MSSRNVQLPTASSDPVYHTPGLHPSSMVSSTASGPSDTLLSLASKLPDDAFINLRNVVKQLRPEGSPLESLGSIAQKIIDVRDKIRKLHDEEDQLFKKLFFHLTSTGFNSLVESSTSDQIFDDGSTVARKADTFSDTSFSTLIANDKKTPSQSENKVRDSTNQSTKRKIGPASKIGRPPEPPPKKSDLSLPQPKQSGPLSSNIRSSKPSKLVARKRSGFSCGNSNAAVSISYITEAPTEPSIVLQRSSIDPKLDKTSNHDSTPATSPDKNERVSVTGSISELNRVPKPPIPKSLTTPVKIKQEKLALSQDRSPMSCSTAPLSQNTGKNLSFALSGNIVQQSSVKPLAVNAPDRSGDANRRETASIRVPKRPTPRDESSSKAVPEVEINVKIKQEITS